MLDHSHLRGNRVTYIFCNSAKLFQVSGAQLL
jgi:hypothetical protein